MAKVAATLAARGVAETGDCSSVTRVYLAILNVDPKQAAKVRDAFQYHIKTAENLGKYKITCGMAGTLRNMLRLS